ncbi:MAG TPA: tetratricopeptide repeat protein, partial [Nannocystaceae bacterium]|nr:tetratricopeptide repeat protein [Nannocystaceae bacterium]
MRTDRLDGSDSRSHDDSDDALTAAGVAPIGLDTRDADRPVDPIEQAALSRAMAKLVPDDYQPPRLGRFILLEPLGKGGMGIVHAGYDDTLDRRVALKLISPQRASSSAARRRLFREAQAMAKLSHPNVVQVFEAGEHEGHLFIAMELVEGETLRAWNRRPHDWRTVLRLFAQIGEGLAAAHEASVVHRDFKPDNVLIGSGEKPKVADFGLATLDLPLSLSGETPASGPSGNSGPPEVLTMTGEVMGTPAYMPLEQFTDRRCDTLGDQFSFCVALYESLYRERPFAGDTIAEIMRSVANREIRAVPARTEVPAWVRAIVLRGLSPRPRERFPDMRTLLLALADDPVQRRRRTIVRVAGIAAVVGSVGVGAYAWRSRPQPCSDDGNPMLQTWGDAPRERIGTALRDTGVPWAEDTARRASTSIDRWVDAWHVGYRDACEATQIRGVQSAAAMDLRIACFTRAHAALAATLEQLATADATVVENAVSLVDALPRLAVCDDVEALRKSVPPPEDPAVAAEVEHMRGELAIGFASHLAGRLDASEAKLRELQALAKGIDYRPLRSEIDTTLAEVLLSKAQHEEAEKLLRSALGNALADGDDPIAIKAAASLVILLGARATRFAEADWVGQLALGLAQRRGQPSVLADVYNSTGGVRERQGRYDESETDFRTALELLQGEYGDDHLEVAVLHENLGTTLLGLGRLEDGLAEHRRALQIREGQLGPDHPLIAIGHFNVGTSLQELGRFEESESELRHAIELLVRAFGPNHPDAAMAYANLGIVLDELGKHTAAQSEYRRSIAIFERTMGPDHPHVAQGYNNLGTSFEDEGRLVEAEAEFRRALVISRRAFGEDHPDVARTHGNLASVLIAMRRYDEALDEARAALAISKRVLGPEHPDLLYAYRGACEAELERARARWDSDRDEAKAGAERAASLCEAAK